VKFEGERNNARKTVLAETAMPVHMKPFFESILMAVDDLPSEKKKNHRLIQ